MTYPFPVSRGPGHVQRSIVYLLNPGGRRRPAYSIRFLAQMIYKASEPTESQMASVRRAVRSLVRDGHVVEQTERAPYDPDPGRRRYTTIAPVRRSRRRQAPVRRAPSGPSVTFAAPCPQCGRDAEWLHTWDDRYEVTCPSCPSPAPSP